MIAIDKDVWRNLSAEHVLYRARINRVTVCGKILASKDCQCRIVQKYGHTSVQLTINDGLSKEAACSYFDSKNATSEF